MPSAPAPCGASRPLHKDGGELTLTIILVDDDPLMHRMLVPRLHEMHTAQRVTHVATALTPEAALQEVERAQDAPLVVVSDFNLKATMNGLQLLSRVRALRPDALRVLFSGYSREQLGAITSGDDVDAFLEKPLILDELVAPLAQLISARLPAGS